MPPEGGQDVHFRSQWQSAVEFNTHETAVEADSFIDCTSKACLRGIRSQGCAKRTASGGDRFAVVLEFEFLSGKIVDAHSMNYSALKSAVLDAFEPRRPTPAGASHTAVIQNNKLQFSKWIGRSPQ
jgi:hypothetical protein